MSQDGNPTRTETLERGDVYFFVRPRVEEEDPESLADVQNTYAILSRSGARRYRMLIIGRKRLPDPEQSGRRRFWGFVERVTSDPHEIAEALQAAEYRTKTRGRRHQPAARPVGEGVYRIVRHDDHTHLAYALELPRQAGEIPEELNLAPEASYILSVKNPAKPSPRGAGLPDRDQAAYPQHLQDVFRGRRFTAADPPELLDHAGTEFVLVSASESPADELDVHFETESETAATAEIFNDLRLDRTKHPVKPLFEGEWD
jgi:hypothetical protein